jgi:hypothetical protein
MENFGLRWRNSDYEDGEFRLEMEMQIQAGDGDGELRIIAAVQKPTQNRH